MLVKLIHALHSLLTSFPQSNYVFRKDDSVIVLSEGSVVHVPLLKRCFQAFLDEGKRERSVP